MFETAQSATSRPILVIDKKGLLAERIASLLFPNKLLLLSKRLVQKANVYQINFDRVIPQLPLLPYLGMIVVFDGSDGIFSFLPELAEKARDDNIPLLFVTPFQLAGEEVIEKVKKKAPTAHIVIMGQLFGKTASWHNEMTMNGIFAVAAVKKRIVLRSWGMRSVYPVFVDDGIRTMLGVIDTPPFEKTLLIMPRHGMSELTFAHLLQKADPTIKVDFTKDTLKQEVVHLPRGKYILSSDYEGMKHVKEVLALAQAEFKKHPVLPEAQKKERKYETKRTASPLFLYAILCALCIVLLPLVVLVATSLVGYFELQSARTAISSGGIAKALPEAKASQKFFGIAKQASLVVAMEAGFVNAEEQVSFVVNKVQSGQDGASVLTHLLTAYQVFTSGNRSQANFIAGLSEVKLSLDSLQSLQTNASLPQSLSTKLSQVMPAVAFVKNTSEVLPQIVGFDKQKTYLVLFQNNMELRPTGGFIGSYGLLSLDKGKLAKFTIHDVYESDGQLKAHFEPPFPIRRYLPSAHLYLRDSNFSLSFPDSASVAATLLYSETKQKVDGVIAVDLSFVKYLLLATGPIPLPDYKTVVTADNFFLLTEQHVEKNFFPGSTQKKNFLSAVFSVLQAKLFVKHEINYEVLAASFGKSLSEKHLLFAFSDPSIQNLFTINSYSDAIWDDRQTGQSMYSTYLGENEANLGVNKANYFIKRKMDIKETVSDKGEVRGEITLYLNNTSTGWPGGEYKTYLRFLLPGNTTVTKIQLDGNVQQTIPAITDPLLYESNAFSPPGKLELWQENVSGKTTEGFLTTVGQGKTKTISVFYTMPFTIDTQSPQFSYHVRLFKQPGTEQDPYTYSLIFPSTYQPLSQDSRISIGAGTLSTIDQLVQDTDYHFSFSKK